MKLIISREKWLRGEGSFNSRLYRSSDQKMCCLGFLSLVCGAEVSDIEDIGTPNRALMRNPGISYPAGIVSVSLGIEHTDITDDLMSVNDSYFTFEKDREKRITELFAKADIDVEFVP